MKTMAIDYAKKLDNAIEDVNLEYAMEAGTKISNDMYLAAVAAGMSMLCIGDAAIHTTKLTVRTAKTGIKKAVIKASELYYESAPTIVRR